MSEQDRLPPTVSATVPVSSSDAGSHRQPDATRFVAGAFLGDRYELLGPLGRGAHGAVHRAHDRHADQIVALKIILDARPDYLALLRRELAAARSVTHPSVVRMYDLVEIEGGWALSMEFIEGTSLERLLEQGPLPTRGVETLGLALAEALAAAHAASVVHRDLKPANILVRADGRPVVTDFGISCSPAARRGVTAAHVNLTVEGAIVGTPLYMAPEQLAGQPAVPASDVYAWGLVVFEAATGRVPHAAETVATIAELRATLPPPSLADARADLPGRFTRAVERSLQTNAADRFVDGGALVDALRGEQIAPPSLERRQLTRANRRLAILFAATAALLCAVVVVGVVMLRTRVPTQAVSTTASSTAAPVAAHAPTLRFSNSRRVTFGSGCAEFPALSPDGTRLVFDMSEGAKSHLHEIELATGAERRLLTSPKWDIAATFSPDGSKLAFLRGGDRPYTTIVLDMATGTTKELGQGGLRPSFSLDGSAIWMGERKHAKLVSVEHGAVQRELIPPVDLAFLRVVPMKSGDVVALATEVSSAASRILRQEAGTDAWTEITRETSFAALATTSGGEVVVFPLAPPGRGLTLAAWTSAHGLVSADAPGVEPHSGLSFSMDGRRAAWSTCRSIANLSRIENGRLVHVIESGSAYSNLRSAFLSDGRLILISDRDGDRRKLWVASADASGAREVPGIDDPKSLKVLGTKALVSTAKGIWHVDFTSGETVKQLTTTPSDVDATFTHDGSIVLQRAEGTTHGLYLLREGRAPERLPFDAPRDPDGSPIEDKLVFVGGTGAESRLFVVEAGVVRPFAPSLQPALYATPTFSKDGKQLAVVRGRTELVLIDVATERVLRADVLTRGTPGYPVFANDGSLYTNGYDWIGDVWIADVE